MVMSMHSFKAPRSDGFRAFFYKQFWHIVKEDIYLLVRIAFDIGYFDPSWAKTLLVLISKADLITLRILDQLVSAM